MPKLFADRGFLTANGFELAWVKDIDAEIDDAVAIVDTMSRNHRSAGYKQGNRKASVSATLEIEALKAQVDFSLADPTVDVTLVFEVGGERWTLSQMRQATQSMKASVGDGSKSLKLLALDAVNENGTSVNTGISLG